MRQIITSIFILLFLQVLPASGGSLYLDVMEKSEAALRQETREMSENIRKTFDMDTMEAAQQKIDAYDYLSHFKRVLLYGSRLAVYASYEKDLDFARDNELFKGLPEDETASPGDKQDFIDEKYRRMGTDVKNEIDTYEDLIAISLDACELLTTNDFTGFSESGLFRAKVDALFNSGVYTEFATRQDRLAAAWPDLSSRIRMQIALWQAAPAAPGDTLVDPAVTQAISRADGA